MAASHSNLQVCQPVNQVCPHPILSANMHQHYRHSVAPKVHLAM